MKRYSLNHNSGIPCREYSVPKLDHEFKVHLFATSTSAINYIIRNYGITIPEVFIGKTHPSLYKLPNIILRPKFTYVSPIDTRTGEIISLQGIDYQTPKCWDITSKKGYDLCKHLFNQNDVVVISLRKISHGTIQSAILLSKERYGLVPFLAEGTGAKLPLHGLNKYLLQSPDTLSTSISLQFMELITSLFDTAYIPEHWDGKTIRVKLTNSNKEYAQHLYKYVDFSATFTCSGIPLFEDGAYIRFSISDQFNQSDIDDLHSIINQADADYIVE